MMKTTERLVCMLFLAGKCKTWTLDWTGLWTEIWTGFWTDTQFNDDHFQQSVALNGLGYALATAYPKTRLLFMLL